MPLVVAHGQGLGLRLPTLPPDNALIKRDQTAKKPDVPRTNALWSTNRSSILCAFAAASGETLCRPDRHDLASGQSHEAVGAPAFAARAVMDEEEAVGIVLCGTGTCRPRGFRDSATSGQAHTPSITLTGAWVGTIRIRQKPAASKRPRNSASDLCRLCRPAC
jgi:hypothetical protein